MDTYYLYALGFCAYLILPLVSLIFIFRKKYYARFDLILDISLATLYTLFIILSGYWDMLSQWFRLVLLILYIVIIPIKIIRNAKLPFWLYFGMKQGFFIINKSLLLIVLFSFFVSFSFNYFNPPKTLSLDLPFKDGTYSVTDGGNGLLSIFSNYHYHMIDNISLHAILQYAVDIEKINSLGRNMKGFPTSILSDYVSYNEPVYSPCDGKIIELNNTRDDNVPLINDTYAGMGNFIVIETNSGAYVVLMHFKMLSISVKKNDIVKAGDFLALMGNSGRSRWPHLHIHALMPEFEGDFWWGEPLPIAFNGANTNKNALFFRSEK